MGKNENVSGINEIIKVTADIFTPLLILLFNHILRNETFPAAWHIGLIVPLFKSDEGDDPNNYRGITINYRVMTINYRGITTYSCLSKLFMLLLNDRMNNQIGFRKGFRPADHVFTPKTMIDQTTSRKIC